MDTTPLAIARNTIPQIPRVIGTLMLGVLGWSSNAAVQDLSTEILCILARPTLSRPAALLESQTRLNHDYGIKGNMWVAKYTIPVPSARRSWIRDVVRDAVKELGDGELGVEISSVEDVQVEWTGYRKGVGRSAPRLDVGEREQYERLMGEVEEGSPVVLYFHGGAFCLMDPATHRTITSALAQQTRGRVVSVRYRLSPQNPFPAALIDAFVAYLALIDPPDGAFHDAIPPSKIVLAGDSSGAGLAAALFLLLLTLPRLPTPVLNLPLSGDAVVDIGHPAGLALISPWLDISRSLPSIHRNARFDIVDPPNLDTSILHPAFPADKIWPCRPARVETYCEAHMVSHPLVSPLAASPARWKGASPVWIAVGWEGMQDEAEVFARRVWEGAGDARNVVVFEGYVGMPHCFASMMSWTRAARTAGGNAAGFCRDVVGGEGVERRGEGSWMEKDGSLGLVGMERLGMREERWDGFGRREDLGDEKVNELMAVQRKWRMELEARLRKI